MESKINQEETEKFIVLLLSGSDANIFLALQLMEGLGVNDTLMSFVMTLAAYHHSNAEVKNMASDLFFQYASDDLKNHFLSNTQSYDSIALFLHPDVNAFDCCLMQNRDYNSLSINELDGVLINSNIRFNIALNSLSLYSCKNINLEKLFSLLGSNIKIVRLMECQLISEGQDRIENYFIERLDVYNCSIVSEQNLMLDFPKLDYLSWSENQGDFVLPDMKYLQQLKYLRLERQGITDATPYFELPKIKILELEYNEITVLPSSVTKSLSLKKLELSNNKITEIDLERCYLPNLYSIDLSHNQIKSYRWHIQKRKKDKLKHYNLNLSHNQLTTIDTFSIWKTGSLNLSYNQLLDIELSANTHFNRLHDLNISGNIQFLKFDKVLNFKNLTRINLENMNFKDFPIALEGLRKLTYISLTDNKISMFPDDISGFEALENISVYGNPIQFLPTIYSISFKEFLGVHFFKGFPLSLNHKNEDDLPF
jgi:Leucine-rich repeat (LRR) protein